MGTLHGRIMRPEAVVFSPTAFVVVVMGALPEPPGAGCAPSAGGEEGEEVLEDEIEDDGIGEKRAYSSNLLRRLIMVRGSSMIPAAISALSNIYK